MLLDIRTYRCKPAMIGRHLALYDEFGREPQFRCLGAPVFYAKGETPDPNEYCHVWAYDDAADRAAKRALLWADESWLAYTKKSAELGALESQTNKLMTCVDFCPMVARG